MELLGFAIGFGLLFGIPAYAARDTWPRHKTLATVSALIAVAAWLFLCLWLALR